MGAGSRKNPRAEQMKTEVNHNEQQRNPADDVIGKRHSDNGLHPYYGVQYP